MPASPPVQNTPWKAVIALAPNRNKLFLFKVKFFCIEASKSPAASVVDALPLLWSQQPNVVAVLSSQSLGKAARG